MLTEGYAHAILYIIYLINVIDARQQEMKDHCLIVEDISVSLIGIRKLISDNYPSWLIDDAATVEQANGLINDTPQPPYSLIILELNLAGHSGASALLRLKQVLSGRAIPCLVYSCSGDPATIDLCRALGAHGHVSKRMPGSELLRALEVIRNGGHYFGGIYPRTGDGIHTIHRAGAADHAPLRLTPRQKDIVDLLLAGYSNKQIADTLVLTYGTVNNYMFDLMRLLEVNSRLELAVKVRKYGYIPTSAPSDDANTNKFY